MIFAKFAADCLKNVAGAQNKSETEADRMWERRFIGLVGTFLFFVAILQARLVGLSLNTQSAQAAAIQSSCLLPLYDGRAEIYDCEMRPLTGLAKETFALALPGDDSYARLYPLLSEEAAATLYGQSSSQPSLVPLQSEPADSLGIYTFEKPRRYFEAPIAVHTLGYIGEDGQGVSGIERCYDDLLSAGGSRLLVRCTTTASGSLMAGTEPELVEQEGSGQAVQLTLDRDIQRICEGIALEELEQGAIVVMETATGKLRAVVSMPVYDPYDVAGAIAADDSSLLNRAISAYNVGSVFKPIVAAAALEAGLDPQEPYECTGVIEVDGHLYHCNQNKAHGTVTMTEALEHSCNCYFIWLGSKLGGEAITELASRIGFGRAAPLAKDYYSAGGNLPTAEELENSGQLASISFGQGKLLATPIQIAAGMNMIANGGIYIGPTLTEGTVEAETGTLLEAGPAQETLRAVSQQVSDTLLQMLQTVVEEGSGAKAKPEGLTAAGKTGTAQTGRYDEEGRELLDSWFAGFYPAEQPKYTIVILKDSAFSTGEELGPIFARVCEGIELATSSD